MIDARLSKTGVAGPEAEPVDSLAQAIEELREELISWIDRELDRWEACDLEDDRAVEATASTHESARPGLGVGRPPIPRTARGDSVPGMPGDAHATDGEASRSHQRFADRDSNAEVAESPVAVRGSKPEPEVQAAPLDPSQRLDALARLLDRRLKQVDRAPGAGNDATGRGSRGVGRTSESG